MFKDWRRQRSVRRCPACSRGPALLVMAEDRRSVGGMWNDGRRASMSAQSAGVISTLCRVYGPELSVYNPHRYQDGADHAAAPRLLEGRTGRVSRYVADRAGVSHRGRYIHNCRPEQTAVWFENKPLLGLCRVTLCRTNTATYSVRGVHEDAAAIPRRVWLDVLHISSCRA